jgi:hypothetical protein
MKWGHPNENKKGVVSLRVNILIYTYGRFWRSIHSEIIRYCKSEERSRIKRKNDTFWNLYVAVKWLDGEIVYEEIDGEYVVIDITFSSNESLIKFAGLKRDFGYNQAEVLAILVDENHPRHNKVREYLDSEEIKEGTAKGYQDHLANYYHEHKEEIQEMYKDKYPNLPSVVANLPLEVLQYVIDLMRRSQ